MTVILESNRACYRSIDHEEFFDGWPSKPSYELVKKHFESSHSLFLINESSEVVGFISALTDHALYAFIALIEVRKSDQGKGYGKLLVAEMVKSLGELYAIDLVCDADLESFYAQFGFKKWNAMIQRNPNAIR